MTNTHSCSLSLSLSLSLSRPCSVCYQMKLKGVEEEQLRLGFVLCRKDSMCRPCRWFDATVQV